MNVVVLIVAGFMASLNVALTDIFKLTPVASLAGEVSQGITEGNDVFGRIVKLACPMLPPGSDAVIRIWFVPDNNGMAACQVWIFGKQLENKQAYSTCWDV